MLFVPIIFEKIDEKAVIPQYKTEGAACFDLVATKIEYIAPNLVEVSYGFKTEIPEGYKVEVQPRSSFTHSGWVMQNSPGQIDSDFRGEWKNRFEGIPNSISDDLAEWIKHYMNSVGAYPDVSFDYPDFPAQVGERVVQGHVEEVIKANWKEGKVNSTARADGSYGSTGK
jgi:dUTPase